MLNKFDQRLIDFLTMICWWTEVKWEKNNIFWVYQVDIFEMMLTVIFWYLVAHFSPFVSVTFLCYIWIALSLIRLTILVFAKEFYLDSVLSRYPQGCPNYCRFSDNHKNYRKIVFFTGLSSILLFYPVSGLLLIESFPVSIFIVYIFVVFLSIIYYYFLACDSIPPEEKAKRKARVEMWIGNLQPIPISGN